MHPALPQTCRDGAASVNRENSGYIATGLLEEDMAGLLCRWSIQVPLISGIFEISLIFIVINFSMRKKEIKILKYQVPNRITQAINFDWITILDSV